MKRNVAVGTGIAIGLLAVAAWPYTVDDAFIVDRYARHLARGWGWAMNPGRASDGVTSLAWILPGLAGWLAGVPALGLAKGLGLFATALAAALGVAWVGRRTQGLAPCVVCAVLLGVQVNLSGWAVAGLETGLATLVVTLAALAATRRPAPHGTWLGIAGAALATLRPETVPVVVTLAIASGRGGGQARSRWTAIVLTLGGVGLVMLVRWQLFGSALPLAVAAKPAEIRHGVTYMVQGLWVLTGGTGAALIAWAAWRSAGDVRVLAWALAAHAFVLISVGGDWMPGFRLWVPLLPTYAMAVARSLEDDVGRSFLARAPHRRPWRSANPRAGYWGWALIACTACVPMLDMTVQLPRLREAGAVRVGRGPAIAQWLRRNAKRVALVDVGYLAWSSGVEVVDLAGITEPDVAKRPGGHLDKQIDPAWLAQRDPDVVLVHTEPPPRVDADGQLRTLPGFGVERRIARTAWLRNHYRVCRSWRYVERYHYVAFCRR